MNFATVLPENVDWQLIPDGLGARYAVVFGNPEQAGSDGVLALTRQAKQRKREIVIAIEFVPNAVTDFAPCIDDDHFWPEAAIATC